MSDTPIDGKYADATTATGRKRKVPLRTKLYFSSGAFQEATVTAAGMATVLFYNQIMGVSAALCGTAFLIASVIDGISDPIIGTISDRFKSRWGRRHPFMLVSALPLGISFYFLYQPISGLSETGYFVWLVVFLVLMRLATTFYNIPHDAMGAELTDDYNERTSIFGYNSVAVSLASVLMALFVLVVLFPSTPEYDNGLLNESRYPWLAFFGAIIIVVAVLACTLGTRDQIPYMHQVEDGSRLDYREYFGELWQLVKNPSYLAVCVSWLTIAASLGILGMVSTYTYIYVYELSTEAMTISGVAKLPGILTALPLVVFLSRFLDKKQMAIIASAVSALLVALPHVLKMADVFPANDSPFLLVCLFGPLLLGYMVWPVIGIVVDSQLVDVADEHEFRTGKRAEGIVFSVRTFAIKATSGLGGLIGGFGLEFIGFPEDAKVGELAPETLNGLLFLNGPLYLMLFAFGIAFMGMYRINKSNHESMLEALEKRRSGR